MVNNNKWSDPRPDREEPTKDTTKFGDYRDEDKQYDFCTNDESHLETVWPGLDHLDEAKFDKPLETVIDRLEEAMGVGGSDRRTVILGVIDTMAGRQINLDSKAAREMLADKINSKLYEEKL